MCQWLTITGCGQAQLLESLSQALCQLFGILPIQAAAQYDEFSPAVARQQETLLANLL